MRRLVTVAMTACLLLAGGVDARAQVLPSEPLGPVVVIAHRGASAYRPEHTFPAYDLAVEQDVDFLECDLQLTADDVLVCVHDTTVDRTSDGSGNVRDFTLAELRQLDWGSWFSQEWASAAIVPFEEQVDCYLGHNANLRFHVETKGPSTYGGRMEELLVELLGRKGLLATGEQDIQTSTFVIQSFDPDSLRIVKELAPSLPTALLWPSTGAVTPELVEANALFLAGLLPDYVDAAAPNTLALQLDPTMVARFHLNGHEVHAWTVNDTATMDQLLDMGVDGIFTNNPDLLRAAVDARGTGVPAEVRGNPAAIPPGCPGIAGTVGADVSPGPPADEPSATPGPGPVGDLPTSGGGLAVAALVVAVLARRRV